MKKILTRKELLWVQYIIDGLRWEVSDLNYITSLKRQEISKQNYDLAGDIKQFENFVKNEVNKKI